MRAQQRQATSRRGGTTDHLWNLIGGALVSAMIAGVIYVLIGMIAQFLNHDETYWNLNYLKYYFAAVLFVYMVMPTLLANIIGAIFGTKSKASGTKKNT